MEWYDLTATERARALAAILDQQGAVIAREAHRNYAGSGSSEDFLMDLLVKILGDPPDVPVELAEPGDPWMVTVISKWTTTVIHNKRKDAYRAETRHADTAAGTQRARIVAVGAPGRIGRAGRDAPAGPGRRLMSGSADCPGTSATPPAEV